MLKLWQLLPAAHGCYCTEFYGTTEALQLGVPRNCSYEHAAVSIWVATVVKNRAYICHYTASMLHCCFKLLIRELIVDAI
jgi:hypothetical protein